MDVVLFLLFPWLLLWLLSEAGQWAVFQLKDSSSMTGIQDLCLRLGFVVFHWTFFLTLWIFFLFQRGLLQPDT